MNTPDGEFDARFLQRFAPSEHMLVDAIHQRTIKIEQKGNAGRFRAKHLTGRATLFQWLLGASNFYHVVYTFPAEYAIQCCLKSGDHELGR